VCALALAVLAEEAGVPPGIINIVTCSKGRAPEVGEELTTNRSSSLMTPISMPRWPG